MNMNRRVAVQRCKFQLVRAGVRFRTATNLCFIQTTTLHNEVEVQIRMQILIRLIPVPGPWKRVYRYHARDRDLLGVQDYQVPSLVGGSREAPPVPRKVVGRLMAIINSSNVPLIRT